MNLKDVKKYIYFVIYALSAVFLIYYFNKYFSSIRHYISLNIIPYLLISLFLNIAAFFSMGFAWVFINKKHNNVSALPLLRSFFVSQITRYVPGNIWSFLARLENGKKLGISRPQTTYFYAVENINLLFGAFLFSIFSLDLIKINNSLIYILILIVILLSIYILYFRQDLLKIGFNLISKLLKIKVDFNELNRLDLVIVFVFFSVYWVLFGFSFYFISLGFLGSKINIIDSIGINAAAWLVGYLSFLTPSGLGVREGVFVILLQKYAIATIALPIAIASRFIFTISEIIGLGIIILFERLKKLDKHFIVLIILMIIYIGYFSF